MTPIEQSFINVGREIGAQNIAYAILVASLHDAGLIKGDAVAQAIRLASQDKASLGESGSELLLALAGLINRTIAKASDEQGVLIKPLPEG